MQVQPSVLVAVAVLGAAAYAFTRDPPEPESHPPVATPSELQGDLPSLPGEEQDESSEDLEPDDEAPAIRWTAPAAWPQAPNTSPIRIATHRVPHVKGDEQDAELSIARAGGDTEANIERWVGQFTESGAPRRTEKTVHGLAVTIVAIEGTYQSGMGTDSSPHTGWAMLAAIVRTPGLPYFFKLTGPAATVRAARAPFDGMLEGVQSADVDVPEAPHSGR
jgi:hypothetical protein